MSLKQKPAGNMSYQFLILYVLISMLTRATESTGQYYFATSSSYTDKTLNSSLVSQSQILGDTSTVTQQCRRNCALNLYCQAFRVLALEKGLKPLVFNCSFFQLNSCNWTHVALLSPPIHGAFNSLWDKVDATTSQPKACSEYCAVQFEGNCTACRGMPGFTGLDCETGPRLCSDYNVTGWGMAFAWPWGFYGPSLHLSCYSQYTRIFQNDNIPGSLNRIFGIMDSSGWVSYNCSTPLCFNDTAKKIDWPTISYLVSLSKQKELYIREKITSTSNSSQHTLGGLELTADGALSLNSSQDPTGFPIPLYQAPFVFPAAGSNCSAFWQFERNVSVCDQRTHLLSFGLLRWNGPSANAGPHASSLMIG